METKVKSVDRLIGRIISRRYQIIICLDTHQQKLARNRQSARDSRKRKKIYIELLENKVEDLSQEVLRLEEVVSNQNTYITYCAKMPSLVNCKLICRLRISILDIRIHQPNLKYTHQRNQPPDWIRSMESNHKGGLNYVPSCSTP